jgi:mono/diheme cytochrome c family protein
MPAYGKQISPDEMAALVDFMASLRPPDQPNADTVAHTPGKQPP